MMLPARFPESTPTPPTRRRRRRSPIIAAVAAGALAIAGLAVAPAAFASHPEVSLFGSSFEIDTDANLKVDDAGSADWASFAHAPTGTPEIRKADAASGSGDNSFGQGAKEDTEFPAVVSGSIPPNKSDLLNFGMTLEENVDTDPTATVASDDLLHLFWHRVQEPNGTTNMDFEFNQNKPAPGVGNGITPDRLAGDVLIQYDLSQGGVNPVMFVSRWVETGATSQCEASNSLPCWSDKISLTEAGDATGSINASEIPVADSDGLATTNPVSPRTFGEATVNFSAIVGEGKCVSFGSAYLKSRSSDSFTSALKDFISPVETPELTNCAKVIIHKETVPNAATRTFDYTSVLDVEGTTGDNPSFTLGDGGTKTIEKVFLGDDLSVTETHPLAAGWALSSIDCSASVGVTVPPGDINLVTGKVTFDLDDSSDVLECTYTNTLQTGSLLIVKERKHVALNDDDPSTTGETHPHAGVEFTVSDADAATADIVVDTGSDGTVCVPNLLISSIAGNYTVKETVPDGYVSDDDSKDVAVTLGDGCAGVADSVRVEFLNTPLTDLTVSVHSQIEGGTFSSIECDATTEDPDTKLDVEMSNEPAVTIPNLEPGTYTCVVVIDP